MQYGTDAFKVGISDLKHTKCKTSLIMNLDGESITAYCPKCKEFLYDRGKIRLSKNPDTKRKIIAMILTIGSIEFRVEYLKKLRKKENEHRRKTKPTEGT